MFVCWAVTAQQTNIDVVTAQQTNIDMVTAQQTNRYGHCPFGRKKHDLVQSGKSSLMSWPDIKLIPQTNSLASFHFHDDYNNKLREEFQTSILDYLFY